MKRKAAAALKNNPIELTQDDLASLMALGIYKRKSTGKLCIVARTEFPCFVWKTGGTKDKCLDGDYIVVDEDGKIRLVAAENFETNYAVIRFPSFADTIEFVAAPVIVPEGPGL